MRRLGRVGLAAALGGALLGMPAMASAVLTSSATETNTFSAGSLATPTGLVTIHPTVTGAGNGDVRLTWTDTLSRAVTYLVQRAPAASPTSWATVNGLGSGTSSATLCTGTVPGAVTCSYDDNAASSTPAASYNASYVYQVVSKVGGWTAPSAGRYAGSLPPASGAETYLVPPDLNAVSAQSATSMWAVGANCTVDYYNGSTWTLQTVPTSVCPTGTSLNGVDAFGGLPMVVGSSGVTFICTAGCTTATPTWAAKSTAALGSPTLYAVSADSATQMWAVGSGCSLLYYNGTSWTGVPVATAQCAAGTTLYGVHSNNKKPVAAGAGGTLFTCTANCLGTGTPTLTTNTPAGLAGSTFYAVAMIANNAVWAVGSGGAIAVCVGSCQSAGTTWSAQTSNTTATLRAVSVSTVDLVQAAGDGGTILRCSASCNTIGSYAWTPQTSNTSNVLTGIVASATGAVAVGRIGTIVRVGGWAQLPTGVSADLKAVSGVSSSSVWAVGANCTVLHYDGVAWSQQAVPTAACPAGTTLNGVDALGSKPMIVGDNGVTFVCKAAVADCTSANPTWTPVSTAALGSPSLNAVSAGAGNKIWAVGAGCAFLFYDGTAWSSLAPPTAVCPAGTTLHGLNENGEHPVAGGTSGVLFTCTGGGCDTGSPSWVANAPVGLTGSPTFHAVSVATDIWAVGTGGTIAVCTGGCGGGGATWTTQTSGTSATLRGTSAASATLIDAVGDSGTIRQCTVGCGTAGGTWAAQDAGTTTTLNGVYVVDAANAHVVGPGGAAFGLGTSAFAVVVNTSLPVNVPTTYALVSGDLTALSSPDSVLYATHGKWPASALPTSCTTTTPGVVVRPASTVPAGTWPLTKAVATVILRTGSVPSGGAAFQLLVSPNNGGSWTAYPVTTPTAAGTSTLTSIDVTTTLATTSALATTQLCLQGSSGGGPLLTSSVDLMHLDVN